MGGQALCVKASGLVSAWEWAAQSSSRKGNWAPRPHAACSRQARARWRAGRCKQPAAARRVKVCAVPAQRPARGGPGPPSTASPPPAVQTAASRPGPPEFDTQSPFLTIPEVAVVVDQ
ncbi:hypothetical protein FQR65_LT20265 [Abscondita terminalis]|nr:hypothetical protein FQR65_LT20265 [Abscondita terminalis]